MSGEREDNNRPPSRLPPQKQPGAPRKQYSAGTRGFRRRSFAPVGTVLNKLVSGLGLDQRLREHTLMSLWPTLVEAQIAERTRPLFLDIEGNMVIAVRDAATGQELSLRKPELVRSINQIARSLNVSVKGMRFDLKHFHSRESSLESLLQSQQNRSQSREPVPAELDKIVLNEAELGALAELRRALEGENPLLMPFTERILSAYERELRLKLWRLSNNYPLCPQCREPCGSQHGSANVCADCFYENASQATPRGGR